MEQPNSLTSSLQGAYAVTVPPVIVQAPQSPPPSVSTGNPLMKHFRQPKLFIKLTSNGAFWAEGSLELPVSGEIPVYPMTAADEIILRTPDALINGTSVVQVIQSCCPSIKNAWAMPSIDVDSTLIAIRIASFGPAMAVTSKCPHCGEEHEYDVNLETIKDQIIPPDYNTPINVHEGLTIKLKPLSYDQVSKASNVALEEDRMIQSLSNPDIDDEVKKVEYEKHIKRMIEINVENATTCTAVIIADGVEVTNAKYIKEYYQNTESTTLRKIQQKVQEFADAVNLKPQSTLCTSCEKEFKLSVEFDYSRFFANGS